jgi:hypothetical protein
MKGLFNIIRKLIIYQFQQSLNGNISNHINKVKGYERQGAGGVINKISNNANSWKVITHHTKSF